MVKMLEKIVLINKKKKKIILKLPGYWQQNMRKKYFIDICQYSIYIILLRFTG